MKRTLSPSLVISILALIVACSGTAMAAVQLANNSVATKHLKDDAVISRKVKNGTLKTADFADGTLLQGPAGPAGPIGPQGPQGQQGQQGQTGPRGTALGLVSLLNSGTYMNVARGTGTGSTVTKAGTGIYCIAGPFADGFAMYYAAASGYTTWARAFDTGSSTSFDCPANNIQIDLRDFNASNFPHVDGNVVVWMLWQDPL